MTRIVTRTYRYKPPPKRKGRKLAEITGPAIVTAKGSRRREVLARDAAAEVGTQSPQLMGGNQEATTPTTTVRRVAEHHRSVTTQPANDDGPRKSAIVTARKPRPWRSEVPVMTPEVHQRRGDAADALFREIVRRIGVRSAVT